MGKRIGVVGSGTMGSGIAQAALSSGNDVVVIVHSESGVNAAVERIRAGFEKAVAAKAITTEQRDSYMHMLEVSADYKRLKGMELVVEAVSEVRGVKDNVLKMIEANVEDETVIATNTSSIPISELSKSLSAKGRFIGMHFFNPVPVMRVVEIVRGESTSQEAVDRSKGFATSMGKTPIEVRDSPGFVANRLLMLFINEAANMLEEGIASREGIDTIVRLGLRHPMGPLELADFIGIDVCSDIMSEIYRDTGDVRFKPSIAISRLLDAGRLGRKSGEGFYRY